MSDRGVPKDKQEGIVFRVEWQARAWDPIMNLRTGLGSYSQNLSVGRSFALIVTKERPTNSRCKGKFGSHSARIGPRFWVTYSSRDTVYTLD